jgi:hypothetical protein
MGDLDRANRQFERMFPSAFNRDISPPQLPTDMENALHFCENCQEGGSHECTGKGLNISIVYNRVTEKIENRREEIPCQCKICHPKEE